MDQELKAAAQAAIAREKDIRSHVEKPIAQYQRGLLTFDEFVEELAIARQAAEAAL